MKNPLPPRLARLLGEYEKLTRDESAALRAQDFVALGQIHAFKPAVLAQIIKEGTELGLDRRVLWFDQWLGLLAASERENLEYAGRVLRQIKMQKESVSAARHRLRGFGHAYARVGTPTSRLFARS